MCLIRARGPVDDRALREAQQIADRRDDHVPHVRTRDHLLDVVREVREHHDGYRARIAQLMLQLARRVQRIGVDYHQSGAQCAEHCDRILQYVRHHQGNPLALAQATRAQPSGKIAGAAVDLFECQRGAEIVKRRRWTETLAAVTQHVDERRRGIERTSAGVPGGYCRNQILSIREPSLRCDPPRQAIERVVQIRSRDRGETPASHAGVERARAVGKAIELQ